MCAAPVGQSTACRNQPGKTGRYVHQNQSVWFPSRTVGKYRRVRVDDLMAYKRKDDEARAKVLDQLAAEAQELGMGS
jgi:hypothetical protein